MTKKQKIWLWIFIAMFVVPEILWSPIGNFYYELSQTTKTTYVQPLRNNFFQISDNSSVSKFIILLQFVGLLLVMVSLTKNVEIKNKLIKYLIIATLIIFLIMTGFILYFASTFSIEIL